MQESLPLLLQWMLRPLRRRAYVAASLQKVLNRLRIKPSENHNAAEADGAALLMAYYAA